MVLSYYSNSKLWGLKSESSLGRYISSGTSFKGGAIFLNFFLGYANRLLLDDVLYANKLIEEVSKFRLDAFSLTLGGTRSYNIYTANLHNSAIYLFDVPPVK